MLIGGAAKNSAVQQIAAKLFGGEVVIPAPGEYVADGAAKQAAWALTGAKELPDWKDSKVETLTADYSEEDREVVSSYLNLISKI